MNKSLIVNPIPHSTIVTQTLKHSTSMIMGMHDVCMITLFTASMQGKSYISTCDRWYSATPTTSGPLAAFHEHKTFELTAGKQTKVAFFSLVSYITPPINMRL